MSSSYRIAAIPGDGIGKEVVPEGVKVLEAVSSAFELSFEWGHFDWSCERYLETGEKNYSLKYIRKKLITL